MNLTNQEKYVYHNISGALTMFVPLDYENTFHLLVYTWCYATHEK
jgi:hypothetical protein